MGIVIGQVVQRLLIGDRANLLNIACDPTKQIDRMASAADNAVTKGIVSPVFLACVCLEHMIIVMRIFGLDKGELADAALVDQLLCANEAGGCSGRSDQP